MIPDEPKRIYIRMLKRDLKLLPYALWAGAFFLIFHGSVEGSWTFPILGVLTAIAGWVVKRLVRNLPDDDDHDFDDMIYHGVPVEAPEPVVEKRTDKLNID
ncbi:MAG: hypothetical protein QGD90_00570 [Candidatus Hydrogenedentes bacterium]|nr:hypothetical protein [Candidatus Hydrogenedentota bacterium]